MSIINDALKKVQENRSKKELQNASKGKNTQVDSDTNQQTSQVPSKPAVARTDENLPSATSTSIFSPSQSKTKSAFHPEYKKNKDAQSSQGVRNTFFAIIGIIISSIAIGSLIPVIYYNFILNEPSSSKNRQSLSSTNKESLPPASAIDKINISGIMTMDNRNVVLINNKIYEKGDTVEGLKIINISLDTIEFLEGDKIKKIEVR